MPQAKPRVGENTNSRAEGTYEEVHAAIQELSRLMGVTSADPASYQIPSGYGVYTYPNGTSGPLTQPPQNGVQQPASSGWQNGHTMFMPTTSPTNPSPFMQPFSGVLDQYTGLPACVATGYPAWGPYLVPGSFR